MKIRILAAVICAAAVVTSSSVATAGYVTTNASLYVRDGAFGDSTNPNAPGPPLVHLHKMTFGNGQLWTNQVDGNPFELGSTVRTVGAIGLSDVTNGQTFPVVLPDGSAIHAVFAVEGIVTGAGEATFHGGSLYFVSRTTGNPEGTFNPVRPETWNFDNAFAKYDLLPPAPIIDGNTQGISPAFATSAPASDVNVSGVSGLGTTGQGIFAFAEDLAFTAAGIANPGLGGNVGSEWLFDLERSYLFEGILPITDQTLQTTPVGLTGAQIAILDAISLASYNFSGPFSEGGFNPTGAVLGGPGATGDFSATLSAEAAFITAIPEPSSLAIFALLGGGAAIRYGRKRSLKKA